MIKKILISQPQPSAKSPYFDIEKAQGVEMVFRPFFKVEGITAKEFRQQKINILDYSAVVFTSRHAVDNYFKLAKEVLLCHRNHRSLYSKIRPIPQAQGLLWQDGQDCGPHPDYGEAQGGELSRAAEFGPQRQSHYAAGREGPQAPRVCDVPDSEQRTDGGRGEKLRL